MSPLIIIIIAAILAATATAMYRAPQYEYSTRQNFAASMVLGLALWTCVFWIIWEVIL